MSLWTNKWFWTIFLVFGIAICWSVTGCGGGSSDDEDEDESESSPTGIYTIGGYNEERGSWWKDVWKYNGSWVYKTSVEDYIAKYACVISGSTIYVFGGEVASSLKATGSEYTNKMWKYSVTNGTVTELSSTSGPSARIDHTAVLYNSKIYVFGGYDGDYDKNVYVYNTATDGWGSVTPSRDWPDARRAHSAVVYDGKMYIFGGYQGSTYYEDLWAFDFDSKTWTQIEESSGYKRYAHGAVVYSGKMYIFGGINSDGDYLSTLLIYNFSTEAWTKKTPDVAERAYFGMTLDNSGNIYIVGGYDGTNYLQSLIKYDIADDDWTTKSSPPDTRAYFKASYYNDD